MKMFVVITALLLSPLLVHGDGYEDYPEICDEEILTLTRTGDLPNNFVISPKLRCVNIVNSRVSTMESGAFEGLPSLLYLNLQLNSICPNKLFSFGTASNIRALILSDQNTNDCYYSREMLVSTVYPELRYLNLKNAAISMITNGVRNPFPQLTHLDLSYNDFSSFAFTGVWKSTLKHLNLNGNKISRISLEEFSNLISLTLDDNNIQIIGENSNLDLSGLTSLEHLSITNNQVNSIRRAAFADTVNLRYLNISKNHLSLLHPDAFMNLTYLEVLVLDENEFDAIPLKYPLNVTVLSMNCNRIKYLTANSFYALPYLRKLYLAGNQLTNIFTETFQTQSLLEELHLNDNELSYLPTHWARYLTNLRYLDLTGNRFASVGDVLDSPDMPLQLLYLGGNPIEYITRKWLEVMPTNLTIYLTPDMNHSKPVCKPAISKRELDLIEQSRLYDY